MQNQNLGKDTHVMENQSEDEVIKLRRRKDKRNQRHLALGFLYILLKVQRSL